VQLVPPGLILQSKEYVLLSVHCHLQAQDLFEQVTVLEGQHSMSGPHVELGGQSVLT
jgi:hypothetical protein